MVVKNCLNQSQLKKSSLIELREQNLVLRFVIFKRLKILIIVIMLE